MSDIFKHRLEHEPVPLKFGTSGRRGRVADLTQLEVYLNAFAELQYLQSLPVEAGGIRKGDEFFYAYDLRPSSTRYVPAQQGRGELAQAVEAAIIHARMKPVNLGAIPTPALAFHALQRGRGSMMITGSHIPFDRNGYKTNSARGELLKSEEAPIQQRVALLRDFLYGQPFSHSLFDEYGCFKAGHRKLLAESAAGREGYLRRYLDFFAGRSLGGMRLLVYQHSAVGRDLLVELLEALGAMVVPAGRSDTFVPIDTENIDAEQLATIQSLADQAGDLDAVVSTDGDSDRPLVLGVYDGRVRFFGGDLLGMLVAEFLGADSVVVPISCNDAIDRGPLKGLLEPKTRIGSPYVIAGMEAARSKGKRAICGWEANGGFLTGSDIKQDGRVLAALPTRDAFLPILTVLFAAAEQRRPLSSVFDRLPARFSRAALRKNFPRAASEAMLRRFSCGNAAVREVYFESAGISIRDEVGEALPLDPQVESIRTDLEKILTAKEGFGRIVRLNYTDGLRIYFANGDVAHVRSSGNADELRIYAVADSQDRADQIAALGVAEPDGILRRLERA